VNGAGGAGDNGYTVTVGLGSEIEVLYGELFNGDTSNRTAVVDISDGTNRLGTLINGTLNAGARSTFPGANPFAAAGNPGTPTRIILSGAMVITATVLAVAASQDSALGLVCRIRGPVPTVVEAGASTPTITINTERVF